MDNGEYDTPVVEVVRGRKSRRQRNSPKTSKYTQEGKDGPDLNCDHHLDITITGFKKRSLCQALKLSFNDLKEFRRKLYLNSTKIDQDKFLLKYMRISIPKRRSKVTKSVNYRKMSIAYFVPMENGAEVQVCSKTFQKITGTQRMRLLRVANAFLATGSQPKERRGGKSAKQLEAIAEMTDLIKNDIMKYKCRESHYSRSKCSRSYLPPELNLKIMYEKFIENQKSISEKTCSLSKYKSVFYKNFNLGFGNPHEDTCSACKEFLIKIKNEKDLEKKNNIRTEYRLHKLRAKQFFSLLNDTEDDKVIKICFDCQQNQPLPKLSVGEVFYSRQAWLYNFCVMQHKPKTKQTKDGIEFYVWLENQSGRGANEIASALQHYLRNLEEICLRENKKDLKLELYSDSCSSQNKNFIMLTMLANFMASSKVFNKLSHIFPIPGHSFMPPDRVFGRVEKDYRRREVIVSPKEYYSILGKHGQVNEWGKDWYTYNMKATAKRMIKTKLPFKISQTRIIHFTKVGSRVSKNIEVGVQDAYSAAPVTTEIKKKRVKSFSRFDCDQLPKTNMISLKKKADVENLLKFCDISDDLDAREFYDDVLQSSGPDDDNIRRNYDDEEPVL
ncbi:unnamed protein product [Parnassius mnemosyne]|uniref:DUF7869 domain-containing protein n=1 Tax=Parnassius mnemosyne TaxID=213953 RepID=A0AAV1LTG0_9NEOP